MNKNAWTLAELTIAITILLVLTAASVSMTKNININQTRLNLYAAIRNLTMANIAIKEKPLSYSLFYPKSAEEHDADDTKTNNWYCINVADAFSLKTAPNCAKNLNSSSKNITMQNGTTYKGLATSWEEAYSGLFYKNVTIDVNGDSLPNKLGIDIFPIRVFRGKKYNSLTMDGIIMPVSCAASSGTGTDDSYSSGSIASSSEESVKFSEQHPACGSDTTTNFFTDANFFSQNIYRVMEVPNRTSPRARMIVGSISTLEADCLAHGGKGYFSEKQCKENGGYTLHKYCANKRTCKGCKDDSIGYNVCPKKDDGSEGDETYCNELAESNEITIGSSKKYVYECFYLMDKPSSGLGILGAGALDGLDL